MTENEGLSKEKWVFFTQMKSMKRGKASKNRDSAMAKVNQIQSAYWKGLNTFNCNISEEVF